MARTQFALAADVWTDLGTGVGVMTISDVGQGILRVNTAQVDATAERFQPGSLAEQVAQNVVGDTLYAKPSGTGWVVVMDL